MSFDPKNCPSNIDPIEWHHLCQRMAQVELLKAKAQPDPRWQRPRIQTANPRTLIYTTDAQRAQSERAAPYLSDARERAEQLRNAATNYDADAAEAWKAKKLSFGITD